MELIETVIVCILTIAVLLKNNNASQAELVISESQLEQIEKDLIKEQKEFKNLINATTKLTTTVRSQIKSDQNLKHVMICMDNVTHILRRLGRTSSFDMSNFQNTSSTLCKKTQVIISSLENDVKFYLQIKKGTEENSTTLTKNVDELKIQYFANFIFFNKNQSENVLASIALQEKLAENCKSFAKFLYSSLIKIATVLYDVKVINVKYCETSKNSQNFTSKSSTSQPASAEKSVKNN